MLEPAVEKIIMYIPVDDDTFGGTPMLKRIGLNIAPAPKPKAPDTMPPKNARINNFRRVFLLKRKSLSTIP